MQGRPSALNLTVCALIGATILVLSSLTASFAIAETLETHVFVGGVGGKQPRWDVHKLTLTEPSTIRAKLRWKNRHARLKLFLRDSTGRLVVARTGKVRPKRFKYEAPAGTWRIAVRTPNKGSVYRLKTTIEPSSVAHPPLPIESCTGVPVSPGMDLQAVIDAQPPGTTFCFGSGTYQVDDPIVPKSGNQLLAAPGTVLDGGGGGSAAIWGSSSNPNVTVGGFIIQDFANAGPPSSGDAAIKAGANWLITDNEVRNNARIGIRLGGGSVVRRNYVHHNGQYGIVGGFVDDVLWEGNEISFNNTENYGFGDAGATKLVKSSDVTFRDNYVHHNNGNGLWADTDNIGFLYEGNRVEHNVGSGILHETSYDAVIRDNVVRYNAAIADGQSIGYGSNIQLSVSQSVEIYGNTVVGGTNGIGLHDIDRGTGAYGQYRVANVWVHDNVVKMAGDAKTGLNGNRPAAYSPSANNRFEDNSYYVSQLSGDYWYWGQSRTWPGWQTAGQDSVGSLYPW
jgi:Right handed beta helix region